MMITEKKSTIRISPKTPVNNEFMTLMPDIIALFAASFLGIYGIILTSFYESIPPAFEIR
jgi:hypothetical protein